MAGRYRYLLTDVLTGKVLSDAVSLNVSSYARRLNNPTDCAATLDLSDPQVRRMTDPILASEPRRTALWIIRNEAVVWGGIIWTRRYRSTDNSFDLTASSWESYFARRRIIWATLNYSQIDQHTIMTGLVNHAQSIGYGNVGIQVPTPGASGQPRDRTYFWYERATYLERMQQLAEVINGPDFTVDSGWGAQGQPVAYFRVGTPLGRPSPVYVIEFPGEIRNYSWPDDGGNSANYWTAIGDKPEGAPEDQPPPMANAQMSAEWIGGVPLLEDISQHQGVVDLATLQSYATANVLAASGNRVVPEATVRLPADGDLPGLGDTLTVRVTDAQRFPPDPLTGAPGVIARVRVTGWTVNLSAGEDETLSATLSEVA